MTFVIIALAAAVSLGAWKAAQEPGHSVEAIELTSESSDRTECYHQNLKLYCPSEDENEQD